MKQTIDLRLNYPVLPDQDNELKTLLNSALQQSDIFTKLAPVGGSLKDRQTGANWLSHAEYQINPGNVHIGTGGHHGCIVALLAARLHNKTVAVEELTYSNFKSIAKLFGLKLIPCLTDNFGLLPSSLERICQINNPEALYIMPTVNNPTGTVMPFDRRKEIVKIARENNLLIIEDDAYGFLEERWLPNFSHLAPERTFYIYSFSKPLAQSIKTNYLLAPQIFSEKVTDALRLSSGSQSTLFSFIVNTMIESGRLNELIAEKRKEGFYRQQQAKLLLKDYSVSGHKNGWHLWLNLPEHIKSDELNEILQKDGISIMPSTSFSVATKSFDNAIRISFGGESNFNKVISGIEYIKQRLIIF